MHAQSVVGTQDLSLPLEALVVLQLWVVQHFKPYVLVLCVSPCYMLSSLCEIPDTHPTGYLEARACDAADVFVADALCWWLAWASVVRLGLRPSEFSSSLALRLPSRQPYTLYPTPHQIPCRV